MLAPVAYRHAERPQAPCRRCHLTGSLLRFRFIAATAAGFFLVPGVSIASGEAPSAREIARISPAGNYLAARIAGQSRDMAAAAAYYRGALRADPKNPELVESTFLVVLATGDVEESFPLAERLIGFERSHRMARLALAARAIKRSQWASGRNHLSLSVRGPIADLTATLMSSWTLAAAGDFKNAVANIDRLQGPDWYAAFKDFHAGLMLDFAGQRRDAGARLKRAYEQDKNAMRTVDAYGRGLARSGDRKGALEVYGEFAKVLPDHPLLEEAVADINAGRTPAPLVRSPQAGAAEVLFGLGSVIGRQGGEDLGLVYLNLALYLEPEHPLALLALGDLYEAVKKPELAIEAYARIPENSPLKRNAEIQRALNLDSLERTDEARARLTELIAKHPNDMEAIIALGNILRARKHFTDAIEVYSKAVALAPQPARANWTLFYFRGICYERSKQWPLAEKDFQKSLELNPDQPQVLNYLGYSWVDQGINLDQGLEMIKKAVELRPKDGYIVDSLGWAYYRLGRFEDAAKELERAIELRPEDPVINDHLGDAYWKVGRHLEARFQWRHALDLKPEPEDIVRIQAKLSEGMKEEGPASAGTERKGNGG
ncbi:MAG: tetratricopeptide repeat protein [Bradyrhizobiaceae bacterium]|nr:tetratricopeptide repeat protein [Bradyrhizobiaceae bacterium]